MTLFKLRVTTLAISCNFLKLYVEVLPSSEVSMNAGKATEAKLQTAVSSGAEYSTISQHKFDDLMTPKFF